MVDRAQQAGDRCRFHGLDHGVRGSGGLGVAAREVECYRIAELGRFQRDAYRTLDHAVAVEKTLGLRFPVRYALERLAQAPLGGIDQLFDHFENRRLAFAHAEFLHQLRADAGAPDLPEQVAQQQLGCARIVLEDALDAVDQAASFVEFARRDQDALVKDRP